MIAHLGMYLRPETRAATERFWGLIRAHLGYGPEHLTDSDDFWGIWQSPDLLLSQTCGYPYRARLHEQVQLVGTPDYALPGCPVGYYNSVFVARADDPRAQLSEFDGACFAYNEPMSQSGWAAPRHHYDQQGLRFGPLLKSGGHRLSALAVSEGRADFAALDALTWALVQEHDPFSSSLREIERTAPTPTLPFITGPKTEVAPLFEAVTHAVHAISDADRKTLHLQGVTHIPSSEYFSVATPEKPT